MQVKLEFNMDIEKIMMVGVSHEGMDATYAFKLPAELKDRFIEVCRVNNLSTGRVMREMIEQFLAGVEGKENA